MRLCSEVSCCSETHVLILFDPSAAFKPIYHSVSLETLPPVGSGLHTHLVFLLTLLASPFLCLFLVLLNPPLLPKSKYWSAHIFPSLFHSVLWLKP